MSVFSFTMGTGGMWKLGNANGTWHCNQEDGNFIKNTVFHDIDSLLRSSKDIIIIF